MKARIWSPDVNSFACPGWFVIRVPVIDDGAELSSWRPAALTA